MTSISHAKRFLLFFLSWHPIPCMYSNDHETKEALECVLAVKVDTRRGQNSLGNLAHPLQHNQRITNSVSPKTVHEGLRCCSVVTKLNGVLAALKL